MEYKDLVSIIIPIYKVEQYLPECIDSVLNQTYKNLEIILVDDGSPDSCPKICDDYAAKDKRITVVHKQNGGLSSARNSGIDVATGEWIMFFDSDDVLHPQMIERMLFCTKGDTSIQLVACSYKKIWEKYEKVELKDINYSVLTYDEYVLIPLNVIACAKLYKRILFEGIRFPVGKLHEDEFTTWKVCDNANKIAYLPEELYLYRQREESIMAKKTKKNFDDALEAFFERLEYFQKKNNLFQWLITIKKIDDIYCSIKGNIYGYFPGKVEMLELKKMLLNQNIYKASFIYKIKHYSKIFLPRTYCFIFRLLRKKKSD